MSAEQLEFWTTEELKQHLRDERHWANRFKDRVRLAKHLLAAGDEPDLQYLVVDENSVLEDYEEPPADALSTIGPGSTVEVCRWVNWGGGRVRYHDVFITHRSGDELCGSAALGLSDERERVTFELKHICYVKDDGVWGDVNKHLGGGIATV